MEDVPGKNPEQSLSEVVLMDIESKTVANPKFKQYFIELPRFVKGEKECVTIYDKPQPRRDLRKAEKKPSGVSF